MESVGIYDVKQGIKDMSVFTVPDICRTPGTVINVSIEKHMYKALTAFYYFQLINRGNVFFLCYFNRYC